MTEEENELLTRVGPGTPGGEMLRRYWQPAALADELPVGGPPLPIRLLGEDLVLFRVQSSEFKVESEGRLLSTHPPQAEALSTNIGVLALHCSHRGADLSYGRIEDGGIRCIYHGWLYDVHGRCLEQPGEPAFRWTDSGGRGSADTPGFKAQSHQRSDQRSGLGNRFADGPSRNEPSKVSGSAFHQKIQHRAYPCREMAGLILTYMGPGEPPEVPAYPFLIAPDECRANSKLFSECNYLQANEGNIDSVHLSFLHMGDPVNRSNNHGYDLIEPIETDYGLPIFFVHHAGPDADQLHIRHFVLPNLSPGGTSPGGRPDTVNWHVPIDDTHHWKYWITASPQPIDRRSALNDRAALTPDYHLVRHCTLDEMLAAALPSGERPQRRQR